MDGKLLGISRWLEELCLRNKLTPVMLFQYDTSGGGSNVCFGVQFLCCLRLMCVFRMFISIYFFVTDDSLTS